MRSLLLLLLLCGAAQAGPLQNAAAKATANSATNACSTLGDFYWEIGSPTAKLTSGQRGTAYTATTKLAIASASKWLYGAYVAQTKILTPTDRKFLRMSAGYSGRGFCGTARTVAECAADDTYTASADGLFSYGGSHFQQHALSIGLGPKTESTLGTAVSNALGVPVTYTSPLIAGGAAMTAKDYAAFLRKQMTGTLRIGALLGTGAVCTDCPTALNTPSPPGWLYSVGHWVEPDGSFSSAGAFGFYPWISADKSLYGVLARKATPGSGQQQGFLSQQCGKLIRDAYRTGVAQ